MNCYGSGVLFAKMIITDFHKVFDNVIWGSRSINKKQVVVRYSILKEVFLIIFLIVESNYSFYVKSLEDLNVFVRVMSVSLVCVTLLDWTHEGHKFSGYNPVDITIFYTLEVLIFFDIESLEIIPLKINSMFESL